jgi:hypothetical protein
LIPWASGCPFANHVGECQLFYVLREKEALSRLTKVEAPTPFFDYILLLGCLTFITLVGYSQVQFTIFGQRFGLAVFIPMIVLFFSAYYFDHLGVLSMAITNWLPGVV